MQASLGGTAVPPDVTARLDLAAAATTFGGLYRAELLADERTRPRGLLVHVATADNASKQQEHGSFHCNVTDSLTPPGR